MRPVKRLAAGVAAGPAPLAAGQTLFFALLALWPWELFQRLPYLGVTAVALGGAALIALGALRAWVLGARHLRTGIEAPLLLFAAACAQSVVHSADRAASLALLQQYATHAALFYACVLFVPDARAARRGAVVFLASCVALGIWSALCASGAAHPALLDATRHLETRAAEGLRDGPFVRVAAATLDYNQAALPLALSVPLAIGLLRGRFLGMLAPLAAAALLAGVAAAFSRSTLIALAVYGIAIAGIAAHRRRTGRVTPEPDPSAGGGVRGFPWRGALAAAIACAALLALLGAGYLPALAERFQRGIASYDPSYHSRIHVLQIAWELLPRYFWLGTGLDASDPVIATRADWEAWRGITLHSVPLKILLETGVLGFAAYLWIAGVVLYRVARRHASPLRGAFLGAAGVLLALQSVQPFMALSLYPLLLALVLGPIAPGRGEAAGVPEAAPARFGAWAGAAKACIALLCAGAIAAPNAASYQERAGAALDYANAIDAAQSAERAGAWDAAASLYAHARDIAEAEALREHRYDAIALSAAQAEKAFMLMGLRPLAGDPGELTRRARWRRESGGRPDPGFPPLGHAARYGAARSLAAAGQIPDSIAALSSALADDPGFPEAWDLLAELYWLSGAFPESAAARNRAAEAPPPLPDDAALPELLAHARALLRHGKVDEARRACRLVLEAQSQSAEAHFLLGAAAEFEGDPAAAWRHYGQALDLLPEHGEAAQRRAALEWPGEAQSHRWPDARTLAGGRQAGSLMEAGASP